MDCSLLTSQLLRLQMLHLFPTMAADRPNGVVYSPPRRKNFATERMKEELNSMARYTGPVCKLSCGVRG